MIRIKGLVRAAGLMRRQLQSGIRPEETSQFREQVSAILRKVETICAQNGATPDLLPSQSRQAYRYLMALDQERLSLPLARGTELVVAPIRVQNVVKSGDYLADLLWQQSNPRSNAGTNQRQLKSVLQRQVEVIEKACAQQKATPSQLASPSRRVYCWLKFLLSEDNLAHHLAALAQARAIVDRSQPHLERPLCLYLVNLESLWRKNHSDSMLTLKVNEGFLTADQEVWEALIRSALYRRNPSNMEIVRSFGVSEQFNEVLFELESFAGPASATTQGEFHNLDESFERVNAAYFQGSIPKPGLVWSQARTVGTFGHYQPGRDVIMLSLSLDQPTVPPALVDYLLYHELLHKKHGVTVVNGRRMVHTAAFREDERRFSGYREARRLLTQLALGLRSKAQK